MIGLLRCNKNSHVTPTDYQGTRCLEKFRPAKSVSLLQTLPAQLYIVGLTALALSLQITSCLSFVMFILKKVF